MNDIYIIKSHTHTHTHTHTSPKRPHMAVGHAGTLIYPLCLCHRVDGAKSAPPAPRDCSHTHTHAHTALAAAPCRDFMIECVRIWMACLIVIRRFTIKDWTRPTGPNTHTHTHTVRTLEMITIRS